MDWQPIESAPRDGTAIQGWDGISMTSVYWYTFSKHASDYQRNVLKGYWSLCVTGAGSEDDEWTPILWKPLPSPPSAKP